MAGVARFELPEQVPLGDGGLLPFLQAHRDQDLRLSLARLRRLDTPLLQVLLAAKLDWRKRGLDVSLEAVSDAKQAQLALLGLGFDVVPVTAAAPEEETASDPAAPSPLSSRKMRKKLAREAAAAAAAGGAA